MNVNVRGTVTLGEQSWTGARVLLTDSTVTVVDRRGSTVLSAPVDAVDHPDRRTWHVATGQGTVTVQRRGCGCGGK